MSVPNADMIRVMDVDSELEDYERLRHYLKIADIGNLTFIFWTKNTAALKNLHTFKKIFYVFPVFCWKPVGLRDKQTYEEMGGQTGKARNAAYRRSQKPSSDA